MSQEREELDADRKIQQKVETLMTQVKIYGLAMRIVGNTDARYRSEADNAYYMKKAEETLQMIRWLCEEIAEATPGQEQKRDTPGDR